VGGVVLTLRFASELAALAALAATGADVTDGPVSWVLAVVLPLAAALVWGRYVAPASRNRFADPARAAVEAVIFGGAVAGLAVSDHAVLAVCLAVVVAVTAPATRRYESVGPSS
jgi:hypothetical protein